MADVFISYARDDEAVARRVARSLEAAGLDVWWDAELPAHRAYSEVIERNLAEAKAVVVLWSTTAAASQWVRAEADFARTAGKLAQAQLDGVLPPMPFNQIQCADLRSWRGNRQQQGWVKLRASVQALVSGEEPRADATVRPGRWERLQPYRWAIVGILALVVAVGLLLYAYGIPGAAERKPVLAILPFTSLDARDASLVAGMWEDTRRAIGRNPQIVVLGPNTAEQLAKKGPGAAKRAADYLLHASVRTAGDRIRVSTDLVRTKDGLQLWSQNFDRKLDDVFALQSQIASEIEGRIRGRLAEKGGVKPEHIATTGDVYALYSDARAKLSKRDPELLPAARAQLEQVVKTDPNFAPAWAALSEIFRMSPASGTRFNPRDDAEKYARKAIELAPNLAAGHAALALALNLSGPVARSEIERAVALDANDYEAIVWLGNMLNSEGRRKEALAAYTRAAEIEPLYWPAVLNKLDLLQELGDEAGTQALIEQEKRLGASHLVTSLRIEVASDRGDLAEATNIGLAYWKTGQQEGRGLIGLSLWSLLLQLGYMDESYKISPAPEFAPYLWRNDPKGLDLLEAYKIPPRQFFSFPLLPENASRVYVLSGRGSTLANMYLSLGLSPDEFAALRGDLEEFVAVAPSIAVALRESGHAEESARLLAAAETSGKEMLKDRRPESFALLGRVCAAEGRKEDALQLLTTAVNRNWLPRPPVVLVDLAQDPTLRSLKGDARFERLRERILGTIKRERAQVRIADLN